MSTTVLLLVAPFLVLVMVFGTVVIVALCQAKPEDVPSILKECTGVFRRLVDRAPGPRHLRTMGHGAASVQHSDEGPGIEEAA